MSSQTKIDTYEHYDSPRTGHRRLRADGTGVAQDTRRSQSVRDRPEHTL